MASIQTKTLKNGALSYYVVTREQGKPRWIKIPSEFTGKRGRERFLAQFTAGVAKPSGRATLATLTLLWLDTQQVRPSTLRHRTRCAKRLLADWGDRPIGQITPQEVRAYAHGLNQQYSNSHTKHILSVLRSVLSQAVEDGLLDRSPAAIRLRFKTEARREKALNVEEVQALLQASEEPWGALWATCIWTGMRIGEALAMTWDNIDWENGRYNITHTVDAEDRSYTEGGKTPKSTSPVPLSPYIIHVLRQQQEYVEQLRRRRDPWPQPALVHPNRDGTARHHTTAWRAFKACLRAAELDPDYTVHDLRHTCASLLIQQDPRNVKAISEQLRHSSIKITLDTYSHLFPDTVDELAGQIDVAMGV